jgi:hypothetical protein
MYYVPHPTISFFYLFSSLYVPKKINMNSNSHSMATPTPTSGCGDASGKKIRKPYTITKSRESWSDEEHDKFLEALQLFVSPSNSYLFFIFIFKYYYAIQLLIIYIVLLNPDLIGIGRKLKIL